MAEEENKAPEAGEKPEDDKKPKKVKEPEYRQSRKGLTMIWHFDRKSAFQLV